MPDLDSASCLQTAKPPTTKPTAGDRGQAALWGGAGAHTWWSVTGSPTPAPFHSGFHPVYLPPSFLSPNSLRLVLEPLLQALLGGGHARVLAAGGCRFQHARGHGVHILGGDVLRQGDGGETGT